MFRHLLMLGRDSIRTSRASDNRSTGRVLCEGVKTSWGEIINASATGLRLLTKQKLVPGIAGVLVIEGPDGPIRVGARVVWAKGRSWGRHEIGVNFVDVPPEARRQLMELAAMASRDLVLSDTRSRAG